MDVISVLNNRIGQRGIQNAELARRTGIKSELLRRSLLGQRKLKASELVALCKELDLDIEDFEDKKSA